MEQNFSRIPPDQTRSERSALGSKQRYAPPSIKKLMKNETFENPVFPDEVQDFAKRYYNKKKDLLFLNSDDKLCVNYVPQQRALHVRPRMIVMPQLFHHEILYRAHDESGHQGVGKVLARIQERHTWPASKAML